PRAGRGPMTVRSATAVDPSTGPRWERQLSAGGEKRRPDARAQLKTDLKLRDTDQEPLIAAAGALSQIISTAIARTQQLRPRERTRARSLTVLCLRALELPNDLHHQMATHRAHRYEEMQRGLDRLRRFGSSVELLDHVCEEVVHSCGFQRA